ncbi:MAG: hypothetical protein EOP47_00310 [Sphingobacteriaceae bacterium]|nr:MAG: hypothetical protein EOP47_00310 [Sphingobacteriaceae bacterium]
MSNFIRSGLFLLLISLLFNSCGPSLNSDNLRGKWNYTKLESPNANPPSEEPEWKLKMDKPVIEFSKNNELTLWWADSVLSHGTFTIDGKNILFKQVLTDGRTNEFPFHVTKFDGKQIVFETQGKEGSRVTAVKE